MKKRNVIVLSGILALAGMTGCGTGEVKEILDESRENTKEIASASGDVEVTTGVNLSQWGMDMDVDLVLSGEWETTVEPAAFHFDGSLGLGVMGLDLDFELYGTEEDGKYVTYAKTAGQWSKLEGQAQSFDNWDEFYELEPDSIELSEESGEVNGQETSVIHTKISGRDVLELLKKAEIAKKNFVSLYSLIFAIYLRLLERYSSMEDFLISMPVSIRNYELENIENTIGMLTDFVPFAYRGKNESLLDTINRIQEQIWDLHEHNSISGTYILRLAQKRQKEQIKLNWSFTAIMPFCSNDKKPFIRRRKIMFKVDTTLSRSNVPRTIRFTEDIYNTLMEISSYENISFNQLVLQCCLYAINDYPMKEKLDNN